MPKVNITARLARETKPQAKDTPLRQCSARLRAAYSPVRSQGLDPAGPHRRPEPPYCYRHLRRDAPDRSTPPANCCSTHSIVREDGDIGTIPQGSRASTTGP